MLEVVPFGEGSPLKPTHSLNVLGFFCPVPVAETRKILLQMSIGEILEVWADDPEVLHDMPLLLKRCGDSLLSVEERIGEYRLLIQVQQGGV
ncbi:MAG TPA: sulfurtransferase TusA family protein [Candidatus Poseidoniales archaeon]|nr:MAG: sulfurtransferase TusA family protein [Euryarchaeota archaeon]HIG03432.1 sulfurtransferase TusA family protein [Candidatus Poseidoniales archaeon]HIK78910.1 sulfurtransferase TusA family protein [Candidatus Poseidoniales archaeon]